MNLKLNMLGMNGKTQIDCLATLMTRMKQWKCLKEQLDVRPELQIMQGHALAGAFQEKLKASQTTM